jgi:hypothetical protein
MKVRTVRINVFVEAFAPTVGSVYINRSGPISMVVHNYA